MIQRMVIEQMGQTYLSKKKKKNRWVRHNWKFGWFSFFFMLRFGAMGRILEYYFSCIWLWKVRILRIFQLRSSFSLIIYFSCSLVCFLVSERISLSSLVFFLMGKERYVYINSKRKGTLCAYLIIFGKKLERIRLCSVERKTFQVRFEGETGGTWILLL